MRRFWSRMASLNVAWTVSDDDVRAHLRPVLLRDHLHRHLAGPESGHLDVLGEPREALRDLALDRGERNGHVEAAFELAECFETRLHVRRILARLHSMVRKGGLEPPWAAPLEPKSSASTNSATFAAAFAERASIAENGRRPPEDRPAAAPRPRRQTYPFGALCAVARVRRPLRKFSRRLLPRAAAPAPAGARHLPLRAHGRRHRRRGRRVGRRSASPRSTTWRARSTRAVAERPPPHDRLRRPRRRDRAARVCRVELLRDLLSAFRQDVTTMRYPALRRPARLLPALRQSDRPAAAASLRRRIARQSRALRRHLHGAATRELLAGHRDRLAQEPRLPAAGGPRPLRRDRSATSPTRAATARWRALIAFETARARALLESGRPLPRALPVARSRWSCAACSRAATGSSTPSTTAHGDVFRHRPQLRRRDWAVVAAHALFPPRRHRGVALPA